MTFWILHMKMKMSTQVWMFATPSQELLHYNASPAGVLELKSSGVAIRAGFWWRLQLTLSLLPYSPAAFAEATIFCHIANNNAKMVTKLAKHA